MKSIKFVTSLTISQFVDESISRFVNLSMSRFVNLLIVSLANCLIGSLAHYFTSSTQIPPMKSTLSIYLRIRFWASSRERAPLPKYM